jgi:Na+/H+ antiporter
MIEILLLCFFLVAVTAACAVASHRLGIPHSIVLVITGLALALVPGLPKVELDPEVVMLLFLPPLLYWAGVSMSWRGFWNDIEPITLQAIGCVVFTTCAVAVVAHFALNLPWTVGFVLGAVVSPPDVVAPMAIARRLQIPNRVLTILEGEGLVNDATALIIFRFAVTAAATGTLDIANAVGGFFAIVVGEILYGVAVGWAMLRLRRWARDPDVEITLSLLTPYVSFWLPVILGGSGVLAAVSAGLYVSWNGSTFIPSNTRLQGVFIWRLVVYLIEALLFLLTGLQARTVAESLNQGDWSQLILHGVIIGALVIVIRFVWVYPAAYLPRWVSRTPAPPWDATFAIAFTGIRGVVSLAAAFSIPLTLPDGQPFPGRDTVLFITFCVILMTLLGQGSMLPFIYKKLGLVERGRREQKEEEQREIKARIDIVKSTLARLDEQTEGTEVTDALTLGLHSLHRDRLYRLEQSYETANTSAVRHREELERRLIFAERERIGQLLQSGELSDEAKRRIERELDLEEAQIVRPSQDPAQN